MSYILIGQACWWVGGHLPVLSYKGDNSFEDSLSSLLSIWWRRDQCEHTAYHSTQAAMGKVLGSWWSMPEATACERIFKLQKRVIRIITHSRMRDSCRELFKQLEILPLYSQYIFSLSMFVIKNKRLFTSNAQIHNLHTWFKTKLHPPTAHLSKFQKGAYYSGIKIFNNLPSESKDLANDSIRFQKALRRFLLINSFYNSEEYFNYKWLL
jgi:hypothetical protein